MSREHRFLTGREAGGIKPVFGLTACSALFSIIPRRTHNPSRSILIRAATVGYATAPDFEVHHPEGLSFDERIAWTMLSDPVFREAYEKEGIRVDWKAVRRAAGVRDEQHAESELDARHRRKRRLVRSKL